MAYGVAVLPAAIAGVTLHGIDKAVLHLLHDAHMVGKAVLGITPASRYPHSLAHQLTKQAHHSTRELKPYHDQYRYYNSITHNILVLCRFGKFGEKLSPRFVNRGANYNKHSQRRNASGWYNFIIIAVSEAIKYPDWRPR